MACGVNTTYTGLRSKDKPVEYEWRGVYEWPREKAYARLQRDEYLDGLTINRRRVQVCISYRFHEVGDTITVGGISTVSDPVTTRSHYEVTALLLVPELAGDHQDMAMYESGRI